jgi:hypothetical protein
MNFEEWLNSENRKVWIQMLQDDLNKAVPQDATSLLRYGAKMELLESLKVWLLVDKKKPEEVKTTMAKAGQFRRNN